MGKNLLIKIASCRCTVPNMPLDFISTRMQENNSIEEVFLKFLAQYQFDEANLNQDLVQKHTTVLQILSDVTNSGTAIFDLCKRHVVYYSPNFGKQLGYKPTDYETLGQMFFAEKIHPEDAYHLSALGVSMYKLLNSFSSDEKLNHKIVSEYRMRNTQNDYVRVVEQYQVLELDHKGQIWLMMMVVDLSPDQGVVEGSKSQLLNFRTGKIISMETPKTIQFELTKREKEILRLVKEGLLSKEISGKLSISLHTVNTHRQRVLEKLGANNSFEAIMFASKFGLLE